MRKLLFVTQQLDPTHPTLGSAAAMVRALAERVDEVVVVALSGDRTEMPPNVRLRRFGAPTQPLRGARFEAVLLSEIARGRPSALLAHMSPVYALLAVPVLRPLHVPVLLWFTQQKGGPNLHRASRVVDAILSVDRRSVPVQSSKVHAIGHGIDLARFECLPRPMTADTLHLLSLGRYAEVKGHDVVVRALQLLPGAELSVCGEEATPADAGVRERLHALVRELGLEARVRLLGSVPHQQVPSLLGGANVLVNATHGTSADKVVFEALAACVPAVAASPVFDTLLPPDMMFADGDHTGLAGCVRAAAALPREQLELLRARVAAEHSVEHWADAVIEAGRR